MTGRIGLPASSTHSLVGGLVGAGMAAAGTGSILWGTGELLGPAHELAGVVKILVFLVLSLVIGFAGSFLMHKTTGILLRNARRTANRTIIGLNWCAAAVMAFANAANDSQKQLGLIAMVPADLRPCPYCRSPVLGPACCCHPDRARHDQRRLEDHAYPRPEDLPDRAGPLL